MTPPPVNVRHTQLISNCLNCISRQEEKGVSYCERVPDKGEPWHDLTEGESVSLESVTCDRWEMKTE